MEFKRGTRIKNRYEIIEKIGEGGFGNTYKAIDCLVNRFVAIKCSKNSLAHEARILKEINNVPYISHIYDYFVFEKYNFIVMRLVKGKSLLQYMKEEGGKLSDTVLKQVLPSVFITLDQMHNMGIIHRDISPGNLILTDDNTLYLIDFGAATSIREGRLKNKHVFQHVGLDSPEHSDVLKQGTWTDVYSLCSTIVYLLSGDGIRVAKDRQKYDPVPSMLLKLSLSSKMQNAIMKGLSLDPQKRYDSVLDFAKDFLGTDNQSTIHDKYSVHYHAKTYIGSRDVNQDNFMIDTLFAYAGEDCEIKGYIECERDEYHIVAIADGVASVMHAELASKATIQAVSHFIEQHKSSDVLAENLIEALLDQINEKIIILSEKIGRTASTIAIMLWKNDRYCVANIGDSPIYHLSGKRLLCLTNEHTKAREKLDKGLPASKDDFHKLSRYLGKRGIAGSQMAFFKMGKIKKGDIFLICSDGVSKSTTDSQRKRYLKKDGDKAMKKLYAKCSKNPNMDNCTAIILKFQKSQK